MPTSSKPSLGMMKKNKFRLNNNNTSTGVLRRQSPKVLPPVRLSPLKSNKTKTKFDLEGPMFMMGGANKSIKDILDKYGSQG